MYDFKTVINRKNTDSQKWSKYPNKDILPMWVADMDFRVAQPIIDALAARVQHGVFGYSNLYDTAKIEVVDYLARTYTWQVKPHNIVWLPGLVPGINLVSKVFTGSDESILTFTPVYPPFLKVATTIGRKVITIGLEQNENGIWQFDINKVEESILNSKSNAPRLILLCNPHNPVGRMWRREELAQILELAIKYDLIVCSDEIHCDLILEPDLKHIPFVSLGNDAKRRTITLMAPSKTYNLPGLACSFAVIEDSELLKQLNTAMTGLYSSPNIMGLIACQVAYSECEEWKLALQQYLRKNRDYISERLAAYPEIKYIPPEATYLAWFDVREFCAKRQIENPVAFFEANGLGLSDGSDFGTKGFVRLNFGCSEIVLIQAMDIMNNCLITDRL